MNIELDFFEVISLIEVGVFGSHLKKDLVDRAITEFYWKMTWEERKQAYHIFRQWESRVDKEAWDYEWLEHLILRYNPDNQYEVQLNKESHKEDHICYLHKGKLHIARQKYVYIHEANKVNKL